MERKELIPHLFRTEYSKIVAVLCKHFGLEQVALAEDIASDTFLAAAQTWPLKGVPGNPTAWLYHVAKNKTKNYLQRDQVFKNKIGPLLKAVAVPREEILIDLSLQNINDSQLQMMFAICHPAISPEAQVGLSLRILCGFGIEEIADAFLVNKETINKRLFRAKEKLRDEKIPIELPGAGEINDRLAIVLKTIYLLFNEGYYSESQNSILRKDLCLEAMRLCHMLVENEYTDKPQVNALLSLMCFQASRFEARVDSNGELILYDEQDTTRWNRELISRGAYFLNRAAKGEAVSTYHLEAAIAWWGTQKADTNEKWENILQLYDKLLRLQYSPVAALNRLYALSKVKGKRQAIEEAEKLNLVNNHFYFTLLGELYGDIDSSKAKEYLGKAASLTKKNIEKKVIQKKISRLG